ncbi:MAG: phosphonate metabolism transcriptional regulator PhnF [Burkholderiaceae bacterium]|nr:phosphonate metabolism transcriptional regulator PhnF [Burkholderiaceae bacterium]
MTVHTPPLAPSSAPAMRDSFWTRIAKELADAIGKGTYAPGQRLPSEHALAEQFGVNRHTIRRSLSSLSTQGLVRISQGSGTYVEDFAVDLVLGKRTRHQQGLAHAGLRGRLEVLEAGTVTATAALAQALQVPTRSRLLRLHTLGEAEGQPLHVGERYFPLPRFTGLDAGVRASGSITTALAHCGVTDYTRQESRITAELPSAALAAQLRQPAQRPVLLVESLNVDPAGLPIEWSRTWFAGDRVKLSVHHGD